MFHLYRNVILKILKGTNDGSFYMITKQTNEKDNFTTNTSVEFWNKITNRTKCIFGFYI